MTQSALMVAVLMVPRGSRITLPASEYDAVTQVPRAERLTHVYEGGRACDVVEVEIEGRRVEVARWRDASYEEREAVRERGKPPCCGSRSVTL